MLPDQHRPAPTMETAMTTPPQFTTHQVTAAIRSPAGRGRPPTALDPGEAADKAAAYRDSLAHYRSHARQSLADGDYRQAAEKSWGAYTQNIKAIAADHQSLILTHAGVIRVSEQLTRLVRQSGLGDLSLILNRGLVAARALHQHFYENDLPDDAVAVAVADVSAAIDLMQQLYQTEPLQ